LKINGNNNKGDRVDGVMERTLSIDVHHAVHEPTNVTLKFI